MTKLVTLIKYLIGLGNGNERTNRAKKNIAASFFIKGANILIGLLFVSLTINYLNPTKYGIWITLTSIIGWFGFFDIGLGNGLKFRFAEAIANENHKLAKAYVSTTYAILIIIISILLSFFYLINSFLDWSLILNTGTNILLKNELSKLAIIVFTSFGFTFVLNLISVILSADQRSALSGIFDLIGKLLSLILIYILLHFKYNSLLFFGLIYCTISPLVLICSTIWFFNGKYKLYRPSIKSIDFSKSKDLFNLGLKFFIIQIAAILLYQTNNIIICQLFNPAMVTPYNVAFKYFGIIVMGFMIIVSPFWSAFTEAWTKKDIKWINNIMKNLMRVWLLFVFGGIIMLLFSSLIFKLWIRKDFEVPISISILSLCWALIYTWNGIFSQFLNGIGKIKIQLILGISTALLNIPLALLLGKTIGVAGVLLANVILGILSAWICPLQYKKIINNNATGIWIK